MCRNLNCCFTKQLSVPPNLISPPPLPFYSIRSSLSVSMFLTQLNNVDPSLFCTNRAIPWMGFSLRTGEPQAYLQALPSNLHSPSVLLIRRLWTRRHSNCSQLLQISHFIPPRWYILVFLTCSPQVRFHSSPTSLSFWFLCTSLSTRF